MKKLFKTVAVFAAALAVGMLASCKMNVESGGDFGDVSESVKVTDKKGYVIMDLTKTEKVDGKDTNETDVTWFRWTSGGKGVRGPVVNDYKIYNVTKPNKEYEIGTEITSKPTTLKTGEMYAFLLTPGDYNFYYYQDPNASDGKKSPTNKNKDNETKEKDGSYTYYDKDRVGYIKVVGEKNVGIHLNDKDWKYVKKQGDFTLNVNEPVYDINQKYDGYGTFFYNGDYTVTELWPLVAVKNPAKAAGQQYKTNEELKYKGLELKKGHSLTFLLPFGEQVITTYQPNRGKDTTDPTGKKTAKDYLKVVKETKPNKLTAGIRKPESAEYANAKFIDDEQLKAKENEYWGLKATIKPHGTTFDFESKKLNNPKNQTSVNSSSFGVKMAKAEKTEDFEDKSKSAVANPTIYLDVVPAENGEK